MDQDRQFVAGLPTALVRLAGVPLILHSMRRLESMGVLQHTVVLASPGYTDAFDRLLAEHYPDNRFYVLQGHEDRQQSVGIGLAVLQPSTELVLIHDAERPLVDPAIAKAAINAAATYGASAVAIPIVDTVVELTADDMVAATLDRRRLWFCQTPQVFQVGMARDAHERARSDGRTFADYASLVNEYGGSVRIVCGSPENFKVVTPEDLKYAEFLLQEDPA